MAKHDKRFLYESFEDRKFTSLVSFLCLIYLLLMNLPGSEKMAAKVLPAWPHSIFGGIAAGAFVLQMIIWKKFRHFYPKWYRSVVTWILMLCEWGLLLFTLLFLSWPGYLFYSFLLSDKTLKSL